MKKIKAMLIHLLGGVTMDESIEEGYRAHCTMMHVKLVTIRAYLDLMNGMNADDWCKAAYAYICRLIEEQRQQLDEIGVEVKEEIVNNENDNNNGTK